MPDTTTTHTTVLPDNLSVLISQAQLEERIRELAKEINAAYKGVDELILICILKGGFMFTAELAKYLDIPVQIEFVRLSSYGDAQKTTGTVKPVDLTLPRLNDKHVLLCEDIVDTGLTLNFFMDYLQSLHTPASVKLAVLLDKAECRQQLVKTDFVGFEIEDKYVVGFGLDDKGLFRNLPLIAYYNNL